MTDRLDTGAPSAGRTDGGERPLRPDEVRSVYRRRAPRYDLTSRLYWLLGYPLDRYRRQGIAALGLAPGSTVVEVGCGTGANFEDLVRVVGPTGTVIGVDLTDAMLARARAWVRRHGWANVELVEGDAAAYEFPPGIDAVLSTYALTLVPGFEAVIEHAARALRPGGRFVVVDFKVPEGWPPWLLRAIMPLLRPFAVTLGLAERRPWEALARHLVLRSMEERYLGTSYVAIGERPPAPAS